MDWTAFPSRAEQLIRTVAGRDLDGLAVYVGVAGQLPRHLAEGAEGVYGFTHPGLDNQFREHLGDQWQGRGIACTVNDALLAEHTHHDGLLVHTLGVVLHEASHVLTEFLPRLREPQKYDAVFSRFQAMHFAVHAAKPFAELPVVFQQIDFDSHAAPTWLRIALHLRARAERSGVYVPATRILDHDHYRSAFVYAEALGSEPDQMLDATAAEIISEPMPERYAEIWAKDLAEFQTTMSNREENENVNPATPTDRHEASGEGHRASADFRPACPTNR